MAAVDDLDRVLEQWHLAQDAFVKGDPEPVKEMWSHAEDVSVANPYGPPVRGWDKVLARWWSMPHLYAETARPPAMRSWRST